MVSAKENKRTYSIKKNRKQKNITKSVVNLAF
jgi:hypothetical protein